jgi:hypothetical protein
MRDVDRVLRREFEALFGASTTARDAATASVA